MAQVEALEKAVAAQHSANREKESQMLRAQVEATEENERILKQLSEAQAGQLQAVRKEVMQEVCGERVSCGSNYSTVMRLIVFLHFVDGVHPPLRRPNSPRTRGENSKISKNVT